MIVQCILRVLLEGAAEKETLLHVQTTCVSLYNFCIYHSGIVFVSSVFSRVRLD